MNILIFHQLYLIVLLSFPFSLFSLHNLLYFIAFHCLSSFISLCFLYIFCLPFLQPLFLHLIPCLSSSKSPFTSSRFPSLLPLFYFFFSNLDSLHRAFGVQYYAIGLIRLVSVLLSFAGPLVLNLLVTYMIDDNEDHWHGYYPQCSISVLVMIKLYYHIF